MSLIVAIIVSIVVGAALYGVWYLSARIVSGMPHAVFGIVLILVWLLITLHVTGIYRIGGIGIHRPDIDGHYSYDIRGAKALASPYTSTAFVARKSSSGSKIA